MTEEYTALVIDNGSQSCRVGFAGDDAPHSIVPSLVGKHGEYNEDSYIGEDAQLHRDIVNIVYPLEDGLITNWEEMSRIWTHIFFNKVCTWPDDHPVLITEPPLTPREHRETITQIMFETYNAPAIYVAPQSQLSLYACGRSTGVVIDLGHKVSSFSPIIDRALVSHAVDQISFGGSHLTDYFSNLIRNNSGVELDETVANTIKEKHCYTTMEFQQVSPATTTPTYYQLPDGKSVTLTDELFSCPEALFKPPMMSVDTDGIHTQLETTVLHCDESARQELYSNVVLSGGSSLFPGIVERLKHELIKESITNVNIIAPPERQFSAWVGGSILSSLSVFRTSWISIEEYNERGSRGVHRRMPF